jgi:hypothetical protein
MKQKLKPKQVYPDYEVKETDIYFNIAYSDQGVVKYRTVHAEDKEQAKERSGIEKFKIIRIEEV